jgi:hypothetical protein
MENSHGSCCIDSGTITSQLHHYSGSKARTEAFGESSPDRQRWATRHAISSATDSGTAAGLQRWLALSAYEMTDIRPPCQVADDMYLDHKILSSHNNLNDCPHTVKYMSSNDSTSMAHGNRVYHEACSTAVSTL